MAVDAVLGIIDPLTATNVDLRDIKASLDVCAAEIVVGLSPSLPVKEARQLMALPPAANTRCVLARLLVAV